MHILPLSKLAADIKKHQHIAQGATLNAEDNACIDADGSWHAPMPLSCGGTGVRDHSFQKSLAAGCDANGANCVPICGVAHGSLLREAAPSCPMSLSKAASSS